MNSRVDILLDKISNELKEMESGELEDLADQIADMADKRYFEEEEQSEYGDDSDMTGSDGSARYPSER